MEALRIAAAIVVPWLAGYAWLRALRGDSRSNAFIDWGYGHFLGLLITTVMMRAAGLAGLPFSFGVLLPSLLAATAAGGALAWRTARKGAVPARSPGEAVATAGERILAAVAVALLAWRVGALAVDVGLRPLFPWDAWTQWATKARVWSELHRFVPFIPFEDWLARAPGYTDVAPHYPFTVPLLQAWIAIAQGHFDDAMINLPWLAGYVALGLAIFGQARRAGVAVAWSIVAAYVVLSLPLLDTHVALAGYADFHVAAAFALALMALIAWEQDRERFQLLLAVATALMLPLLKVPGFVWGSIVALGVLVAAFGSASWRRILLLGVAMGALAVAGAAVLWRERLTELKVAAPVDFLGSLADNLFVFDNWHLLWYLLPLALYVGRREAVTRMRGATVALACGAAFLAVVFTGTQVSAWVTDYTTVNRALLHVAPAAAVFGFLLVWRWAGARQLADDAMRAALQAPAVAQQALEIGDGPREAVAQTDAGRPAE